MSVDGQQNAAALSRDRRARLDLPASGNVIRLAILVLLVAVFAVITRGATIGLENLSNVLIQSSIRGIAACGQALVVLTAGLDLSVSGVMAAALMTGGFWNRPPALRRLIDDEVTRANRAGALQLGFVVAMAVAIGLYAIESFTTAVLTPLQTIHAIVTAGLFTAVLRFAALERHALD